MSRKKIPENIKNPPNLNVSSHDIDEIMKCLSLPPKGATSATITLSSKHLRILIGVVNTLSWIKSLLQLKGSSVAIIRKVLNISFDKGNNKEQKSDANDNNNSSDASGNEEGDTSNNNNAIDILSNKDGSTSDTSEGHDDSNSSSDDESDDGHNASESELSSGEGGEGSRPEHNGMRGVSDLDSAKRVDHHHLDLSPGDPCPEEDCNGKLYPFKRDGESREIIRFEFSPPVTSTTHVLNELRCNMCLKVFTPPLPEDLVKDGAFSGGRYLFSTMAGISLLHFSFGMPFYRLDMIQSLLGNRLPESTQFDLVEQVANYLQPLFVAMKRSAANSYLIQGDDVSNRVLELDPELRERNGNLTYREGIHTSVLIATTEDGHLVPILKTGIIHFGELLDEILPLRTSTDSLIVVSDGSNVNQTQVMKTINSGCWQHLREYFTAAKKSFPGEVDKICANIKKIFAFDRETHDLDAFKRLEYLKNNALPLVEEISKEVDKKVEDKVALPKSELGEALTYFQNQYPTLIVPFERPGVPLHNNLSEWCTYLPMRYQANSKFYAKQVGAAIGDVITTTILSSFLNNVNPYQHLHHCLQHHQELKVAPEDFLPWKLKDKLDPLPQHKGFTFWHPPPPN